MIDDNAIDEAFASLEVDPERVHYDDAWRGVEAGIQRARVRRQVALAGVTAIALGALAWSLWPTSPEPQPDAPARQLLADGSSITSLAGPAQWKITREDPENTRVELASRARFEVTPNPKRTFSVRAGQVTVTVLGTKFDVAPRPDGTARVEVFSGKVRVEADERSWILLPGDASEYPPKEVAVAPPPEPPTPETPPEDLTPEKEVEAPPKAPPRRRTSWRKLATRGEHKKASALLLEDASLVRDRVDDLMLAADAMRYSGKPKQALKYLDRVLRRHKRDERAPLAAFTRGRLLMKTSPRKAARAFALASTLKPGSPIVDNAMAREVEAWSRAGDEARARAAAERYLSKFPQGNRVQEVKRFGKLP